MKRKLKAQWYGYGLEGICEMGYESIESAYDGYIEFWKPHNKYTEWITEVFQGRVIQIKEVERKRKISQL